VRRKKERKGGKDLAKGGEGRGEEEECTGGGDRGLG